MALDEQTRGKLAEAIRHRTHAAALALLEGDDPAGARAHLAWARTAGKVLEAGTPYPPQAPHRLYIGGLIGVICFGIIMLAWTLSPDDNQLTLEARVQGVELELSAPWYLEPDLPLRHLGADRLQTLQSPATGLREVGRLSLAADPTGTRLTRLELPKGAQIALEADAGGLRLLVRGGRVRGALAVGQGTLALEAAGVLETVALRGTGPRLPGVEPPPALLEFTSEAIPAQGPPLQLTLEIDGDWSLDGVMGQGFAFLREYPRGSGQLVSTVLAAKGRFPEVKREFELQRHDGLRMEGARSARLTLRRDGDAIALELQGQVDHLEAGPKGFGEDLTPTWLEYLYDNQQLTVAWSAFGFLLALAWRLRGLL